MQSINVGSTPVAGAMSMDGNFSVCDEQWQFDLCRDRPAGWLSIAIDCVASVPEGVEVGADGRVLITTQGTSSTDQITSLFTYDPRQTTGQQLTPVCLPPPPPTPSPLSPITIGRPTTTFRGKLIRTPDGAFIIGLSTINNNAQTVVFVYEIRRERFLAAGR